MLHTVKKDIKKEMNKMDKKRMIVYAKIMKQMVSEFTDTEDNHNIDDGLFTFTDYVTLIADTNNIIEILEHYAGLLESQGESA
tara:strand:- start:43 stop:291 length:249 start_codon:yes stop_codon:yes gene_type:complete